MWRSKRVAKFNLDAGKLLKKAGKRVRDRTIVAFEETAGVVFGKMIEDTPLGIPNSERSTTKPRGNVRYNWQFARAASSRLLSGSGAKGLQFAQKSITGKLSKGKALYLFNNHPAIMALEFGGYPNPVKKGYV